jgi:release factor glutamine methyltransferase
VTPAVLIPRPETELLVEAALELLKDRPTGSLIDVGTGSGAIAVALASELPEASIVAVDRSLRALEVARRNASRHGFLHRVHFAAMDLFGGISPSDPVFDVVVSNPPYIAEADFRTLAPEVSRFEPESALKGGDREGLAIVRRLVREAPPYLRPAGALLIEIGMGQAELLERELAEDPHYSSFRFIKDYSGIRRILHLQRTGSRTP